MHPATFHALARLERCAGSNLRQTPASALIRRLRAAGRALKAETDAAAWDRAAPVLEAVAGELVARRRGPPPAD